MGVTDGMAVNAAITNAAFLNKNQADTMPFLLTSSAGINFTGTASLGVTNNQTISFESTTWRNYIGAGTGASWTLSKRASSTTTDLMTVTDSGSVTMTGALTGNLNFSIGQSTTTTSAFTIGTPSNAVDAGSATRYQNSNSRKNWEVSTNLRGSAGDFNITPSTAIGGVTFTTPVFSMTNAGDVTVAGAFTATGTISGPGSGITAINASNISSGTLSGNRLPNPSASTLGGVESITVVTHNFLTGISTAGVPSQAQPAFTDISGTAVDAQIPSSMATKTFTGVTTFPSTTSIDGSGNLVVGGTSTVNGATGSIGQSTASSSSFAIGTPANAIDAGSSTKYQNSNTQKNWEVSTNLRGSAGDFNITPSTAGGGTTYTTPVFSMTNAGNVTLAGSATVAAGVTPFKVLGDPTSATQIQLGSSNNSSALGTERSTGNVFFALNAQYVSQADNWQQNSSGAVSSLLDLSVSGINLYSAASSSSNGSKAAFWGSSVFNVSNTGAMSISSANSIANGSVASVLTPASGPTGAHTAVQGWLQIIVAGTTRYIPYW